MHRPRGFSFFLLLLGIVLLILMSFVFGLWYFNLVGITDLINNVFLVVTFVISLLLFLLLLGFVGLWLFFRKGLLPRALVVPMRLAVGGFLPLVVDIGRALGFHENSLRRSYIYCINAIMGKRAFHFQPHEILVLTPHCLQNAHCSHRVTYEAENCNRCGKCQIQELLDLKYKMGFQLAVVTGGTRARLIVRELRPKAIVAIACERDLMSGMKDVFPVPVLGVINLRPQGPCFNTKVPLEEVQRTIEIFLGGT